MGLGLVWLSSVSTPLPILAATPGCRRFGKGCPCMDFTWLCTNHSDVCALRCREQLNDCRSQRPACPLRDTESVLASCSCLHIEMICLHVVNN